MPSRAANAAVREADVAVIGAGPAGATAARLLAEWGHSVTLLHRRTAGPALAESLPPSCRGILERIGARDLVDGAGFIRSTGNTVWWGAGQRERRLESFGDGRWGHQVHRPVLDRLLRSAAANCGVSVLEGAAASRVEPAPDGWHEIAFTLGDSGADELLRARWVLDCTGRAGLIGRHRERVLASSVRTIALVGMFDRADGWPVPDASHTMVESFPTGWGWTIPISETRRCVALMLDPTETPVNARVELDAQLSAGLARTRMLGPLVAGAQPNGPPFTCDATAYHTVNVAQDGTIIVGDAASFIDPLSSFGVKKALTSAWLAAVCVHSILSTPVVESAALTLYRERERAYVEAARRALARISREAARGSAFWEARQALANDEEPPDEIAALRSDPAVQAAFSELKSRPSAHLVPGPGNLREGRAVVVGNRVEVQTHFVLGPAGTTLRFLRSVDLVAVADVAVSQTEVGTMYTEYCRRVGAVPLPDFLGALSALIARQVVEFA